MSLLRQCAPNIVAVRSKAWTIFVRSNIAVVGSNSTRGMDGCLVDSVFVLPSVDSGLAASWSPAQVALPSVYMVKRL
jgi:hypothetical protein